MGSNISTGQHGRLGRDERVLRTNRMLEQAAVSRGPERRALLDEVIRLNLPVALTISRQFHHRGESPEDLDQVALLGLTKAVHGFDPEKGLEFLSYAVPTISGEVKRYFRDLAWTVRPPRRIQELQAEITPAIEELSQRLGRAPRVADIVAHLGREEGEVIEALACGGCFVPTSLDDRGSSGDGMRFADTLGGDDRAFSRAEAVAVLAGACSRLKPRDRRILYLRFYRELSQQQIAAELGVTQMQVSRLLKRILRDLRRDVDPGADVALAS